ncbi:outer membrane beta-barrel protein [Pseudoduganella sp. FT93W]|uniref:Outer membrane beta-barrel protein n=1 Tax=Duganella fentianensis TaxID=2692177 RepID=A0A845I5D1_9BURK|nr:porin family protein [Duganella fentianensis]MYN46796.1 outer membrane beta-barrel protein [Duganella fentianensis]
MKKFVCLALPMLAASALAHAEDFYLGANLSSATRGNIQIVDGATKVEQGQSKKGLPYGLYAGYALSKDWAVEAGYRGEAGAATFNLPQNYQMKMHTSAAYLAARGNWALNEDWTLFGKIGIARGEAKAEISGKNPPPAEKFSRTGAYLSVGAAYQVAKGVALDVQLEHTDKLKRDGLVANMDRIALGVKLDF